MYLKVEDAIYHKNFNLVVNIKREDFIADLSNFHKDKPAQLKKVKELLQIAKGATVWALEPFYYIYVENYNGDIESLGVLAHEVSHFVDYALVGAGIGIGVGNTEVRAYYLEYILKQCLTELTDLQIKATVRKGKGKTQGQYDKGKKTTKEKTS